MEKFSNFRITGCKRSNFGDISVFMQVYSRICILKNYGLWYNQYTNSLHFDGSFSWSLSCNGVGTMFDEKILTVNVSNFVYMPTRRTTKLLESNNGSYRMHFNIEHVYPKPTCRITTGKICSKHNRSFNYAVRQLKECQSEKQSHGSQVTDMVFVAISALLFVLLLVYTIHAICKRKKLYDNNTNYRAVSLDTETNDVAFHIQRSLT
ncbi:unnamed protein product [Mytilus coruscus]|uniref:Uncharacterized protein n=1 Tax=Mytilus coruscus TaxID=42192 RepID=A0A6J8APZ7_MYTCO|nr:unnamed protein product [Mytilus coruscus]